MMGATDETQIDISTVKFEDLFDLDEIQKIQDAFASATGVASIITDSEGRPITRASNFCHLCNDIIRKTEKGLENCYHSDAELGRRNPNGPIMQPCLSGGLWDGGASISVGDRQIANWLIGQVLDESISQDSMLDYADEIGANREEFQSALGDVTRMSKEQFAKICQALFLIAGQLSRSALQNLQQKRFIAERKQAEAALIDERNFANAMLDSLPGIFYLYNSKGQIVRWNKNCATVLERSDSEMSAVQVMETIAEEDREVLTQRMQQTFIEGQGDAIEAVLVGMHGKRTPFYLTGRRLMMGNETYLAGIGLDITERKQAEAALIDERNFGNTVLESLPGVFYLYDTEGRLIRWNKNFSTVIEAPDAEMKNMSVMEIIAEEDRELIAGRMQQVFVEGQSDAEAVLVSRSGKRMTYYLTGRRVIMGNQAYLAGIGIDVTERKQIEAEAHRLQEQIIEAQRHALQELSTPIIPVLDRIIVMPLIGSIDSLRAKDITRSLLAGISQYRAKIVIVDITGVPLVDSGVADHLNKTIQAARLKGAQTIITGMSDAVAEAIIDLGIDWSGIQTLSDLQTGLMVAISTLGLKLSRQ
jgi:PAS domain S-box-containing protein